MWSSGNTNSVYRSICSSQCYRSLLLVYRSHLFLLSAVHQLSVLIMKIIAVCITVVLFDNIFHVQKGLLKLSSLTSHTRQALYSHWDILIATLTVKLLKIPAYVHWPLYQTHNKASSLPSTINNFTGSCSRVRRKKCGCPLRLLVEYVGNPENKYSSHCIYCFRSTAILFVMTKRKSSFVVVIFHHLFF